MNRSKWSHMQQLLFLAVLLFLVFSVFARIFVTPSGYIIDGIISLLFLFVFYAMFHAWHQDTFSLSLFSLALILHNLSLYGLTFFGIPFEHYMHFLGGLALGVVIDRSLIEKISPAKRFFLVLFGSLGIGALGEIIEWLGYAVLGKGEGFLLYGIGDEGEWRNTVFDMIFNLFGAGSFAALSFIRRCHT